MSGIIPEGTPAGGSALSGDDEPTGNDGTLGADAPSGDVSPDTLSGARDGEDPLTDDDAVNSNDAASAGGTYSKDPEADAVIKEQLDN
ncbi:MAG: hypothetical protein JWQ43_1085 [Glaciihabitans sp.]|nr:hypothetical protein [Glaciihabitans sp.]